MSPKEVWSQQLAAAVAHLFSQCNVVWRIFYGLGVQAVKVKILWVLYFHQVWLHHLSKVFDSRSS
jgi:hypothetical protein